MSRSRQGRIDGDEPGRDMELASALEFVDPASMDPNYWLRFQSWVLKGAAPELARRRLMADITIGDVMSAWARTVVPTALIAAVVAGMLLFRSAGPEQARATIEDLLVVGLEDASIPAALAGDEPSGPQVAFAGETF